MCKDFIVWVVEWHRSFRILCLSNIVRMCYLRLFCDFIIYTTTYLRPSIESCHSRLGSRRSSVGIKSLWLPTLIGCEVCSFLSWTLDAAAHADGRIHARSWGNHMSVCALGVMQVPYWYSFERHDNEIWGINVVFICKSRQSTQVRSVHLSRSVDSDHMGWSTTSGTDWPEPEVQMSLVCTPWFFTSYFVSLFGCFCVYLHVFFLTC